MLALAICYLNGWAMATDPADRSRAEWPPHPDRVFMALAGAYFETDGDPGERDALEWLERQKAPRILASAHAERSQTTAFVQSTMLLFPSCVRACDQRQGRLPKGCVCYPSDVDASLVSFRLPDLETIPCTSSGTPTHPRRYGAVWKGFARRLSGSDTQHCWCKPG